MLYHHQYAFLCYCIMYQKLLHLHVIVLNKSCTNRSKILSFLFTKYTLLVHRSITSYIIPAFYSSKLRLRFNCSYAWFMFTSSYLLSPSILLAPLKSYTRPLPRAIIFLLCTTTTSLKYCMSILWFLLRIIWSDLRAAKKTIIEVTS